MTAPAWTPEMEARARALLAGAVPGPWEIDEEGDIKAGPTSEAIGVHVAQIDEFPCVEEDKMDGAAMEIEATGQLIAAAPFMLGAALAEIERLRGEVKRLETEITDYALTRVTGRLGPTNAEIDAADNAAGRRRARRRK
ncbi:hypothetical protein [Microbacterium sp.]|uniref:hypothetical protein n=1 Tax=Microbacterium sp. TaxID=51671 RepID=UPI002E37FBE1|nr:hypothetical protein [Microbacterium sp.]HEX5730960.1 hypothetical protein [Microbacterium sp.]